MVDGVSNGEGGGGAGEAGPPDRAAGLHACFVAAPGEVVALAAQAVELPSDRAEWLSTQVAREVGRVSSASWAAIGQALDAALVSDIAGAVLRVLERWGVLKAILPEVAAIVGFHRSSPAPHKDLWEHTLKVVDKTPAEPDLRWVALCHDIGKVATRALLGAGHLAFHRHEALGARLFVGIGHRLGMPPERVVRIAAVIEHHPRVHQFDATWTDRAVARLVRELGPHLQATLAFSAADWTSAKAKEASRIRRNLELLTARIARLGGATGTVDAAGPGGSGGGSRTAPAGLAAALIEASGRPPGPWVRDALAWAAEGMARGELAGISIEAVAQRSLEAMAAREVTVAGRGATDEGAGGGAADEGAGGGAADEAVSGVLAGRGHASGDLERAR